MYKKVGSECKIIGGFYEIKLFPALMIKITENNC